MKYTFAQSWYLSLLVAENYPDQEPEYIAAKWYHALWLLIPIAGIPAFLLTVKESYHNNQITKS